MYSKGSKKKPETSARPGSILLAPPTARPEDALAATCDGCGAQIWIPSTFKDALKEGSHRILCPQCLKARQLI